MDAQNSQAERKVDYLEKQEESQDLTLSFMLESHNR